jgi:RND superfamily putative drug exporter
MGNGDSQRAGRAVEAADFPKYAEEQILVQNRSVGRNEVAMRGAVADVIRLLSGVPYVYDVRSALSGGNPGQISADGRSALIRFKLAGDDELAQDRVGRRARGHRDCAAPQPGRCGWRSTGEASVNKALEQSFKDDFGPGRDHVDAADAGDPAGRVRLARGGRRAAAARRDRRDRRPWAPGPDQPRHPAQRHDRPDRAADRPRPVGVDYSLFYLRRKLEEVDHGRSESEALQLAAATSGRAVLVSGMTVIVAMSGMFLAGNSVFTSFAVGTIVVVAVAMLGSVTVLPAVLAGLGPHIEWGKVPVISKRRHSGDSRLWGWILDRVLRRPALSLALGAALLVALSLPAREHAHDEPRAPPGLPRSLPIMQTYDRLQAAFPGGPMPAMIVVKRPQT